ncbi:MULTISPECIES: acyl-CoA dehydrogenase family protein [Amycolatopsis]|uniref:Acyl-CoA dehydrogenase family protein n=1 Tax=Amycolatopsis echigonensis TaxID=2576905 RepID=A0A8E1VUF2_9PSEU|nr:MULTISPECIES: acyl-CoA dehydrogenase family protein [Amycolatopsis]MBB2498441.1 acyl-CoA dehydrogenase family protein [Amycolatopsis echigonensis]
MKRSLYNEDHEAFRESIRGFLAKHAAPHLDAWIAERAVPRGFWRACGEQGLLGLEIPEAHGGMAAGDYRFNAVLFEELARISMALGSMVGIHADVVTPYLVRLTTEEQRRRWLPGVASGDLLAAIAMTEPSTGSDLAAIRTRAVPDGDDWVLSGAKTFITNGYSADLVVVAASTDPERRAKGITLFVVEAGMAGFSRGRKLDKAGQPEADTAELAFDEVRVPGANVLGTVGQGFFHLMDFLPQERLGCAVTNLAHAAAVLEEETIPYCRERMAFGRAIGSFQHNKFLLADLATRVEVTRAYLDECVRAHCAGELTPTEAAKAKWWSSQVQNDILDHCVQLHGGYGYMDEYRVSRAWRDARVTKIWAGSNEIMKELVGRELGF